MVKGIIVALVAGFLVFYAMSSPTHAADIVHHAWHGTVGVAHGVGRFVDKLSS